MNTNKEIKVGKLYRVIGGPEKFWQEREQLPMTIQVRPGVMAGRLIPKNTWVLAYKVEYKATWCLWNEKQVRIVNHFLKAK